MDLTKNFKKIKKKDVAVAGGKGASLGEMTQAGISVPGGFVITSAAFDQFLKETDINVEIDAILSKVKHDDIKSVDEVSREITALVTSAAMPDNIVKAIVKDHKALGAKLVAVRSSATAEDSSAAAWAGQLDTFLNTSSKTLLENIKKCWASLFSPRAIFYRFEKGLHKEEISVAVVIQKMVQSEVSGVAFSVHPVTEDKTQLIIEACWGLGEALVSGEITPDSYVVDKDNFSIIDQNISVQKKMLTKDDKAAEAWVAIAKTKQDKQKLSDKEIVKLAKQVVEIEKHYGFPVDIEWGIDEGKVHILQSRPITTL